MATAPISNPPSVTLDANLVIAYCANESGAAKAKAQIDYYAKNGWQFFAPGVLAAESLYVFCRKLADGLLTATEHAKAVQSLEVLLRAVKPPPNGEASLVGRAEEIRAGYGCSRSADSIYLALAEQLTAMGLCEIITFDADMEKMARNNAPKVRVNLLTP